MPLELQEVEVHINELNSAMVSSSTVEAANTSNKTRRPRYFHDPPSPWPTYTSAYAPEFRFVQFSMAPAMSTESMLTIT